jgi:hypothetical protein
MRMCRTLILGRDPIACCIGKNAHGLGARAFFRDPAQLPHLGALVTRPGLGGPGYAPRTKKRGFCGLL